jgi:hypothetical protein
MFHVLTSEANRNNDDLEGFGLRWDDATRYPVTGLAAPTVANYTSLGYTADTNKKAVTFKPLFGLLNQPKYLPLMWGGLVLELELVTSPLDAVVAFLG